MHKFAIALLTLALTGCATQLGARNTADQRLTMFSQIVFAPDYDSRRIDYLAKWVEPLQIALKDRDSVFTQKYKPLIAKRSASIKDLTGLQVAVTADDKPANVTIYFDNLTGINQFAKADARDKAAAVSNIATNGCHSEIDKAPDHRIVAARIFIHAEQDATATLSAPSNMAAEANELNRLRVNRCVNVEMLRILGLRNASDILAPSIFNSARNIDQTTVLDLRLIRTLYKPELRPGMPRADALRIAQNFLK